MWCWTRVIVIASKATIASLFAIFCGGLSIASLLSWFGATEDSELSGWSLSKITSFQQSLLDRRYEETKWLINQFAATRSGHNGASFAHVSRAAEGCAEA